MKSVFALAALSLSLSASAAFLPVGEFVDPHKVGFMGGYDQESCLADKGEWQDGICILDGEDSVSVVPSMDGGFDVRVNTITTNAHMCDFEGKGQMVSERVLKASAPGENYIPGDKPGEGHMEPVTCELTLTFADDNSVSVSSGSDYSKCSSFCGANAGLDIERAVRK